MRIDMSLPGGASAADQRFRRVGRWWKTLRQVSARGGAAAVMLLVLTLGFLLGKGYWQLHHVFHGNQVSAASLKAHVDPDLLRGEGSGRINILLLGKGGPGHDGPDLTDTILVYSIDPVNHKAALLSVPRDLWVHSSFGNTKINAVYAKTMYRAQAGGASDAAANKAGVQAIEHKVSHLLDIPIHYYAMVDFTAFKQAINTVGGLTLNVPKQLYDPTMAWQNNGSPILAHKGRQHFNGYHALLYARSRETSSDFARTKRQRQVLTALEQKVFSLGTFTNPVKLTKLLDNFGNHAQTDLSIHDTLRLYDIVQQIPAGATKSLGLTDKGHDLMTTDYAGNQSVVRPKAGLFHYQPLQEFVRRALPDGYIVKEHAPITVLNGTDTPKAAHKVAKMLESYGYTVTHVGKAARHYQHTQVFDLAGSSKKYTAHYLRERFASKLKHQLPAGISQSNAKFVIIVGE
jgi:LCP family protein required for cell wall assembly